MRQPATLMGQCQGTLPGLTRKPQQLLPMVYTTQKPASRVERTLAGVHWRHLPAVSGHVWLAEHYRCLAPTGLALQQEPCSTPDALARHSCQDQATLPCDHRQHQNAQCGSESGSSTVLCIRLQSPVVLGYHLRLDTRRMAVPGDGVGCLFASDRRLRTGSTAERNAGHRSRRTSDQDANGDSRNDLSLRSWQSVCESGTAKHPPEARPAAEYEFDRQLLRQRDGRIVLSHAQDRIDLLATV